MEEISCLWSYQENVEELKQKLLCTSLELEQLEMQSAEENRKNKEYIKQLLHLVELALKERDEAKTQLHNLINKIMPSTTTARSNSSITESNSLSGNDGVSSSPDFSNGVQVQQESLLIDTMVQGKPLPQKGKLLKAVLDAGPLLQNLLVAGSLPNWRNPPTVFRVPSVSVKGCDVDGKNGKFGLSMSPIGSRSMSSSSRSYGGDQMMCSSLRNVSNCVVNFGNGGGYGSCLGLGGDDRVIAPKNNNNNTNSFVPLGKRQRLC